MSLSKTKKTVSQTEADTDLEFLKQEMKTFKSKELNNNQIYQIIDKTAKTKKIMVN